MTAITHDPTIHNNSILNPVNSTENLNNQSDFNPSNPPHFQSNDDDTIQSDNQNYQSENSFRMGGTVKFFNSHKGYGFIIPDVADYEVFVHHTSIKSDGGFRSLAEGEYVEFDVIEGPKGMQAANVSGPNNSNVIGDPNAGKSAQSTEKVSKPAKSQVLSSSPPIQTWPPTYMYAYPYASESQPINIIPSSHVNYNYYTQQWMGQPQNYAPPYQMVYGPASVSSTSSHPTSPSFSTMSMYPPPTQHQPHFYSLIQGMNSLNLSNSHPPQPRTNMFPVHLQHQQQDYYYQDETQPYYENSTVYYKDSKNDRNDDVKPKDDFQGNISTT
ncbi:hypothetical protein HDU92_009108 [Lobulomyces angularis]|nr:hypothetical protein HDU92_009108 [Lobulomyces angularis]